mmetsp:Transcript_60685/g.166246  ORF Transcript_60685/g.166246 Transcript_60685/m.166246 type:complete len:224 (-) Transcript_60685:1633-2304(-)
MPSTTRRSSCCSHTSRLRISPPRTPRRWQVRWRACARGRVRWPFTSTSPRSSNPRWRRSRWQRANCVPPTPSWPRRRRSLTLCRRSLTRCRRNLTRHSPTSSGCRRMLMPRRSAWTRPTASLAACQASASAGASSQRRSRTRFAGLRATWRWRAPSSRTWDHSTPISAKCFKARHSTRTAWQRRCRAPKTFASPFSWSSSRQSVTGTRRASRRTSCPSRTASW